jgi:transcriptional regulator with XRE-family HTH domain
VAKPRRSPHRHGPSRVLDKVAVERAWLAAAHALAVRLRELRDTRGWGIEEAAEAAGLHAKHLQRLERLEPAPSHEPNVTLKTLAALATAYGVTVPDLFGGTRRRR